MNKKMNEKLKAKIIPDIKELIEKLEPIKEGFLIGEKLYFAKLPGIFAELKKEDRHLYYNILRALNEKEPYKSKISLNFLQNGMRDKVIEKCLEDNSEELISSSLDGFHEYAIENIHNFDVYIPIDGLIWTLEPLNLGKHKLLQMTEELSQQIIDNFKIIMDTMNGTAELKEYNLSHATEKINEIKDRTCLRIQIEAELEKAKELANEIGEPIFHIFTYLGLISGLKMKDVLISFSNQYFAQFKTILVISSDKNHANISRDFMRLKNNLEIDNTNIDKLKDSGFDKLVKIYIEPETEITELEKKLFHALELLYNSHISSNIRNQFLNYMMIFEIFLNPSDKDQICKSIAFGLSHLLGQSNVERALIFKDFKDMYGLRNDLIHGGSKTIAIKHLLQANLFAMQLIKVVMDNLDKWKNKDDIKNHVEELLLSQQCPIE